jgi:hypothetical protein
LVWGKSNGPKKTLVGERVPPLVFAAAEGFSNAAFGREANDTNNEAKSPTSSVGKFA